MTDPHIFHDPEKKAFVLFHAWGGTKTEINDELLIKLLINNPKGVNIDSFTKQHQLNYREAKLLLNFVAQRVKLIIG